MQSTSNKITHSPTVNGTLVLTQKAKFTKWTASQPITKRLSLAADGSIKKESTAAMLYEGTVTRLACSPTEFIKELQAIGPNDCLSYGLPINDHATQVTTSSNFEAAGHPNTMMPRTAAAMTWPTGAGILMVDYDPEDTILTPDELREALYLCCPAMRDVAHVWAASTSSCLINEKTKLAVQGINGQRVYVFVNEANDIPRAAKVLSKLAWLNGFGHIKISKAGTLLNRSIIDGAVFQSNRIDYCAPPTCERPLAQKKPAPALHGNPQLALDTSVALPELTPAQETQYTNRVQAAKNAKAHEAQMVREQYVKNQAASYVAQGMNKDAAFKMITQALDGQVLSADFVLTSEDGINVLVNEILRNKGTWHGKSFHDPIEPDYHGDDRIARAYLNGPGRPVIRSFAHGGCTYYLSHASETIRLSPGERHPYMERMAIVLNERGEFYRRANRLVSVNEENGFTEQSEHHVLTVFDRSFRFESFNALKKEWRVTDPTLELAKHFRAAFVSKFLPIQAIITAPIMCPMTQRVINSSGYDLPTSVFAALPHSINPVIEQPSMADISQALKTLWSSVSLFPYVDPIDETVMLTAMLTAVLRPLLPTAPGFAMDAPVQASGKTLLTMVLTALSGAKPTMSPWPGARGEPEVNKAIFTKLLEGSAVIVFDNVLGEVDSPSLAAVLTAETYSDRILSKSQSGTVPTNSLILMSGNNIKLKGDLPRRILKCRIDPKSEKPHHKIFPFNPLTLMQDKRQQMVAAALTLIKGYFSAGITTRMGEGRTGSFGEWDDNVRQPVCWLADLQRSGLLPQPDGRNFPRLVDPFNAIDNAIDDDPTLMQLGRLLSAWADQVGTGFSTKTTVKNLIKLHGSSAIGYQPGQAANDDPDNPLLSEVLVEIAGNSMNATINTRKLGSYFSSHADRVVDGRRLCVGETYQNALTWWVQDIGELCESGELDSSTVKKKSNVSQLKTARTDSPKSPKSPKALRPPAKAA